MEQKIQVKAMCLLIQDEFVLVADGASLKSDVRLVVAKEFYRVMGGKLEFDESSEEAVRREIREEVGMEIDKLEFLKVVENRFTYAGERGHEIVFLYKGSPADKLDTSKIIHVVDHEYEFDAVWVPVNELLKGTRPLYPECDYTKFI